MPPELVTQKYSMIDLAGWIFFEAAQDPYAFLRHSVDYASKEVEFGVAMDDIVSLLFDYRDAPTLAHLIVRRGGLLERSVVAFTDPALARRLEVMAPVEQNLTDRFSAQSRHALSSLPEALREELDPSWVRWAVQLCNKSRQGSGDPEVSVPEAPAAVQAETMADIGKLCAIYCDTHDWELINIPIKAWCLAVTRNLAQAVAGDSLTLGDLPRFDSVPSRLGQPKPN